jgi:4-oxalomesaconate tautomerase
MRQRAVPFHFLRGGTSRGPYFHRGDLPEDREALSQVLIAALGAGHPLNIDGIGGGAAVTTKVAMLSPGSDGWADVDYFFAQVNPLEREVDYRPTCGNILTGVGPAAIEMGLVPIDGLLTRVRIRAVNTGARVEALVETPGGYVNYDGDTAIDGVPGTSAPVRLDFLDTAGSVCDGMLPTGQARESIEGIEVTCIDVAMPLMIARAADFGITGYETRESLDADADLLARMERIRLEAGRRMGLGDVTRSVTPKVALLAAPRAPGAAVTARYFMPWQCHPSMAVTGGQCIAACLYQPGSVAEGIAEPPPENPAFVRIEHPSGELAVTLDYGLKGHTLDVRAAGLVRTARLLARGEVMIPGAVWPG